MSDNSYTEVTSQSWFGRIGNALKGVLIGILLFFASFFVLIWNEHRAIDTTRGLEQAEKEVVVVSASPVLPENDGKLVYFSAEATSTGALTDSLFGVSTDGLALKRQVEMYQWEESESSKEKKNLGGGSETVKTYSYNKVWSSELISSGSFAKSSEYSNPGSMPYHNDTQYGTVSAGDYTLPLTMLEQLPIGSPIYPQKGSEYPQDFIVYGDGFYRGTPNSPQIGDIKITFWGAQPGPVSVIGQQVGVTLQAFPTRTGTSVEILKPGVLGAENLFQQAHSENAENTWIFRGIGLVMMFLGLTLVLKPLSVFADVVPLLGDIMGMGTNLVAGLLTVVLGLLTIAITWITVRPLLAVGLIAVAGSAVYFLKQRRDKAKAETMASSATTLN